MRLRAVRRDWKHGCSVIRARDLRFGSGKRKAQCRDKRNGRRPERWPVPAHWRGCSRRGPCWRQLSLHAWQPLRFGYGEGPSHTERTFTHPRYYARMNTYRYFLCAAAAAIFSLCLSACGNKGALVQAPVPEAAVQTVPAPTVQDALEPSEDPAAPQSTMPDPAQEPPPADNGSGD